MHHMHIHKIAESRYTAGYVARALEVPMATLQSWIHRGHFSFGETKPGSFEESDQLRRSWKFTSQDAVQCRWNPLDPVLDQGYNRSSALTCV